MSVFLNVGERQGKNDVHPLTCSLANLKKSELFCEKIHEKFKFRKNEFFKTCENITADSRH